MTTTFKAGERVYLKGNTDHPTMRVIGRQLDMFKDAGDDVLCVFRKAGRRVYRHFEPAKLIRAGKA